MRKPITALLLLTGCKGGGIQLSQAWPLCVGLLAALFFIGVLINMGLTSLKNWRKSK